MTSSLSERSLPCPSSPPVSSTGTACSPCLPSSGSLLLLSVCCLLSALYCLISLVYCLLFTYCLSSTVCFFYRHRLLTLLAILWVSALAVCCLLSDVCYLLSAVCCQQYTVYCLLSTVYCLLSNVCFFYQRCLRILPAIFWVPPFAVSEVCSDYPRVGADAITDHFRPQCY
jgi:hypothetical protein